MKLIESKIGSHFVIIIFVCSHCVNSLEKRWLPNLEWDSKENWLNGDIPDLNSKVIFPLEMYHAVGISSYSNLDLAEIELSRVGSLVLPRNGKLSISDSSLWKGKSSVWIKKGLYYWADPENWDVISHAAPDMERVPCRQDDVILPPANQTVSIRMPSTYVDIKSVKTVGSKRPLTQYEWDDSRDRQEFASGPFTVSYSPFACDKCPCQKNAQQGFIDEVCAFQRPRCGFPMCEFPLKVEGHCCFYCGGRVSISGKVSLALLRSLAKELLSQYKNVLSWYARRTWNGENEVLIKENADYYGIISTDIVQRLKTFLEGEGLTVLLTETSGAPMRDSRLAVTLGPLFGAPLIVLALLLLVCTFFGYSYGQLLSGCVETWASLKDTVRGVDEKSGQSFSFARFENAQEGNVQIADSVEDEAEEAETLAGGRFENPLYRSKRDISKLPMTADEKMIDISAPLSLSALVTRVADHLEEVELDVEE